MDMALLACLEELQKIAARVPVVHGTNQMYKVLRPRTSTGKVSVLSTDPNPSAVYMASKTRHLRPGVEAFARAATKAYGGSPVVARAKIDTKKGWYPSRVSSWAKSKGYELEDLQDIVEDLDAIKGRGPKAKKERGELWEILSRGVSVWQNRNPAATVRPIRYRQVAEKD